MPSSYTTSLRLTLPATGELGGQWGNTVNTGITELLDAAVAGTATISTWGGAGVAYTLSNNSGLADEARKMFIVATGSPGEAKNVICPAVSKMYVFRNDTTGGFTLTLKTPSGVGIAVPAGQYKFLYCDGTNVVEAVNSLGPVAALSASQAVFTDASKNLVSNPITGTGNVVMSASPTLTGTVAGASLQLSSLTSGRVTYAGASGLLQDSTNLTFDGTALTLGGNPTLSAGTAQGVLYLNGSKVATSGSALTFDGTNLGVGVAVPGQVIDGSAANPRLRLTATSTGYAASQFVNSSGSSYFGRDNSVGGFFGIANGTAIYSSTSDPIGFYLSGSEQMRLTSTGLGIGTSSPAARVHAYSGTAMAQITADGVGAIKTGINFANSGTTYGQIYFDNNAPYDMSVVQQYTTGSLIFGTNSTERARITSGGYFKASNDGTYASSTGSLHELKGNPDDNVVRIENYQASLTGAIAGVRIIYSAATPNTTTRSFLYCNDSTTLRAEIRSNGGLANYSANDVNLSDRREKTNFAPAKSYLDTICAIPVQTFNYIDQSEDDPGLTLGVVAQDVQAVAPELVMESNWGTEEAPKQRLSIYQTDLQYALMKCIQEQQALITALTARVAALEQAA